MSKLSGVQLEGKFLVLRESVLKPQYRTMRYRVWKAISGFGCSPELMGRAVWAQCLADGEESRWNRSDFEREATAEEVEAVAPALKV